MWHLSDEVTELLKSTFTYFFTYTTDTMSISPYFYV